MSELRSIFSATSVITAVNPDSLRLLYTNLPPKKVPLCFDLDVQPNLQYVINGAVRSNVDSVLVYSDKNTLSALTEVYTYHVEERDLTDTLVREVAVAPIVGAKIVPKSVRGVGYRPARQHQCSHFPGDGGSFFPGASEHVS